MMNDADKLAETLAFGETSIYLAARWLGWSARRVYAVAKGDPSRFSIIGVAGTMQTWAVALAGERPIQLVMPKEFREGI